MVPGPCEHMLGEEPNGREPCAAQIILTSTGMFIQPSEYSHGCKQIRGFPKEHPVSR